MEARYPLRAHHGMCLAYFVGKGYSDGFTANMARMKALLEENAPVRLVCGTDEICGPCPNLAADGCKDIDKVSRYDQMVLTLCGLPENTVIPYLEYAALVNDRILAPGKRPEICGDCQWTNLCK